MPGLIGFVGDLPPAEAEDRLREMARRLTVRGEERTDLYLGSGVGLGRLALAVVDREPQPIWNEDRSLCILMEGEVYDYADEKRRLIERGHRFRTAAAAEYLLHLYEEYGEDFALRLNGPFAAAIWAPGERRLLLVNDRWGLQPLFVARCDGRFLFASGARALLADPACRPRVDLVALAEFCTFEHVLEDRTLFDGVRLLPPASVLTCTGGEPTVRSYWELRFPQEYEDHPEAWYVERWAESFRRAVRRRLRGEGPVGVLLSGGLDSRAVLAAMDGTGGVVHTFTFGTPRCDDARLAREIAARTGTVHHFIELRPDYLRQVAREGVWLSDGLKSCAHMHILAAAPEVARHVQAAFTGSLGDSIMGNHLRRPLLGVYEEDVLARMLFRHYNTAFSERELAELLTPPIYREVGKEPFEAFRRALGASKALLAGDRREYYSIRQNERRWILEGQRLLRSRVVVRTPFYDNDLVDFMLRVPPGLRLEGYLYQRAFAATFPQLARIPWAATGEPLLPSVRGAAGQLVRQLRWRLHAAGLRFLAPPGRRPYADYDGWMRTALRPWVEELLLSRRALGRGFFNPAFVRRLVAEHMAGANHARRLGVLLTVELWFRQFVEGEA